MNINPMLSAARRYRYEAVLAGIVLVGAGLRFADLGSESIWIDEALSADRARLGPADLIDELGANSVHPPLYFFVLKHWAALFGYSEVGLRSLSALAGVAAIGALYVLARELHDPRAGLIAASILAISPFHIYYSQEARSYSLLFLFAVLSMHAYVLAFNSRRTSIATGYYIVVTLVLLHLHFNAWFVPVAQAAHFAAFRIRKGHTADVRRFAFACLLVLAASVPLMALTLEQVGTAERVFPGVVSRPSLVTLGRNFLVFGGDQLTAQPYRRYPIGIAVLAASALTAFIPFRLRRLPDRTQDVPGREWRAGLLLIWLASAVLLPFFISRIATSIFVGRSLIPALAPLIVLTAIGITRIARPAMCAAFVLAIAVLTVMPLRVQYEVKSKGQWRQAVAYLEENARNGAAVVFQGAYAYRPFAYYQRRPDLDIIVADPETSTRVVARRLRSEREGWLIIRSPRSRQLLEILEASPSDFTVERDVDFGGLRLLRLQRSGPGP